MPEQTAEPHLSYHSRREIMTRYVLLAGLILLVSAHSVVAIASAETAIPSTLITNVDIFDGKSDKLATGMTVLVEGKLIKRIGKTLWAEDGATIIDGGGRTLMPGLIDMHTHVMFKYGVGPTRIDIDPAAAGAIALETMQFYMRMGYTTLRDVGGNSLGLARALAAGRIKGPRLFSSGGAISGISGHADLGLLTEQPGEDVFNRRGDTNVATGPYEVRAAVRRIFRGGGTHIKVMPGGGVASSFDPLEATIMAPDELKAAVDAAADFKSYVCAHAYNDASINRFLDAGGRCIEHGFLAKEETIKRMKKLGAVMSLQAYAAYETFKNPEKIPGFSAENARKGRQVHEGADQMLRWVAKYKVDAFGGSDLWTFDTLPLVPQDLVVRKRWFSDVEILRQNTSYAAEWLAKSGPKNPYKEGSLGVIEAGAYADLILVDGDPLADVGILADYDNTIKLVMKDGEIFKNTLTGMDK
jgi:imidazolonepropionase-like amidohydrolase